MAVSIAARSYCSWPRYNLLSSSYERMEKESTPARPTPMPNIPLLPLEVWNMIGSQVDKKSLKNLRLTNKVFNEIATPYCYETVRFDLVDEWPLRQLTEIANHDRLRKHVKRLVLQRRYGLRKADRQSIWEKYIRFTKAQQKEQNVVERFSDDDVLSRKEWELLSVTEKQHLFSEYQNACDVLEQKVRRITKYFQFRSFGCSGSVEDVKPAEMSVHQSDSFGKLIRQLDESVRSFQNLNEFSHEPAYIYNPHWGTRWRRLCFTRKGVDEFLQREEEEDAEALQLSYALRAVGWANFYLHDLSSLKLHTYGPAFWGAKRLQWLWQGHENLTIRRSGYDPGFQEMNPEDQDDLTEQEDFLCHEQLFTMKHAFANVDKLDITIDLVDEDDISNGAVQELISNYLRQCRSLNHLKLRIGVLDDDPIMLVQHILCMKPLYNKLTLAKPWKDLTWLQLGVTTDEVTLVNFLSSVAKSLRKLTLAKVRILRMGGTLDSFLPKLGRILELDELKLSELLDYVPCERLILKKDFWVWQRYANIDDIKKDDLDCKTGWYSEFKYKFSNKRERERMGNVIPCYDHYEKEIINAILNQTALPELNPLEFLKEHRHECSDYSSERVDEKQQSQVRKLRLDQNVAVSTCNSDSDDDEVWESTGDEEEDDPEIRSNTIEALMASHYHIGLNGESDGGTEDDEDEDDDEDDDDDSNDDSNEA